MAVVAAQAEHIPGIVRLVTEHARRGDVLPRSLENIQETINDWVVGLDAAGQVVACGSLLQYTPTLAEVRSLVVDESQHGQGWGHKIVTALKEQAVLRGIPKLFALTRAVRFFLRQEFLITRKDLFPEKVYKDCLSCPVLENCDEVAVAYNVPLNPALQVPLAAQHQD